MNGDFSFNDDFDPDESFESDDRKALDSQKKAILKAKAGRYTEDTAHLRGLVNCIKRLIPAYLMLMFLVLVFGKYLSIPPSVLIAMLCTTTANVLGLAAIVLRGLFK